jgi:hypothetical protein
VIDEWLASALVQAAKLGLQLGLSFAGTRMGVQHWQLDDVP